MDYNPIARRLFEWRRIDIRVMPHSRRFD